MRLLILSDLHHELWRQYAPVIDPRQSLPDVVVLAGDIDTGAHAVKWAAETFSGIPVLYVHGNHECYGDKLEFTQRDIDAACSITDNVHFLNCSEFRLGSVRFLGATLWTDFRLFGDDRRRPSMQVAQECMTDYRRIRLSSNGYRKLRASDTALIHEQQHSWIERNLDEPFNGKTVVITHMAPSIRSVSAAYVHDPASAAYASNLEPVVMKADLWVHGHMHESFDYQIGKCRVVSNPCGYMTRGGGVENGLFDSNFVVEIDAIN